MKEAAVVPRFSYGEVLLGFCEWVIENAPNSDGLNHDRLIIDTFKARLNNALAELGKVNPINNQPIPEALQPPLALNEHMKLALVLRMLGKSLDTLNNDFTGVEAMLMNALCMSILQKVEPNNND